MSRWLITTCEIIRLHVSPCGRHYGQTTIAHDCIPWKNLNGTEDARFLTVVDIFAVYNILSRLTRTKRLQQLTTNVGGLLSSCIPYTLENNIKPPVCMLLLTLGGWFQQDTSDSLSLPIFSAASELFLLITHDIGIILQRLTRAISYLLRKVSLCTTTTSSFRRARLYRMTEPDRRMAHVRFLALADIYRPEGAFFMLSNENGVITTIDHQRWR